MSDLIRASLIGLALVATGTVPLHAQTATWPEPGDRVRISSNEISGEFRVAGLRSDGLVLQADSVSTGFDIPTASLTRLEIIRGRKSRVAGFLGGGLFGGLAGGAFGAQCAQPHRPCPGWSAAPSALIGAGLGALIGLFIAGRSDEIWREVRLPGRLPITPSTDRLALQPGLDVITRE